MEKQFVILACLFSGLFSFFSCQKEEDKRLQIEFYPRDCKYVLADNSSITVFKEDEFFYKDEDGSCRAQDYYLHLNITSYKPDMQQYVHSADAFCREHDEKKEKAIVSELKQQFRNYYDFEFSVEYRVSECVDMRITCQDALFGREAGADLSDKFVFGGSPDRYDEMYFFLGDGSLDKISEGLTIDKYLAQSPTAFAEAFLKFSEMPEELPLTTSFSVEMEFADGTVLSGSTEDISLTL